MMLEAVMLVPAPTMTDVQFAGDTVLAEQGVLQEGPFVSTSLDQTATGDDEVVAEIGDVVAEIGDVSISIGSTTTAVQQVVAGDDATVTISASFFD